MPDVPLQVVSENAASERRISPEWTIRTLKTKLESVTGIPPFAMRLILKAPGSAGVPIDAADEDAVYLSSFSLTPYAELQVIDTRPPGARPNFNDTTGVEKFIMPEGEYEKKTDSVLAWKKAQKLGRFDPNAPDQEQVRIDTLQAEVNSRGIEVGKRCKVGGDDTRRGEIKYVGDVSEIPNGSGAWVGVHLDEPLGKNDGSIAGKRYWGEASSMKHGVFVRPDRVDVGDFPPIDDLEEMEEI